MAGKRPRIIRAWIVVVFGLTALPYVAGPYGAELRGARTVEGSKEGQTLRWPVDSSHTTRFASPSGTTKLSSRLNAFNRPQTSADESDAPPAALAIATQAFDALEERSGRVIRGESRRLLMNVGASKSTFLAYPTERGWVCYTIPGYAPLECVPELSNGISLSSSWQGSTETIVVHGLIEDDVAKVELVVAGDRHKAQVGTNAFFLELSGVREQEAIVEAAVLTKKDGTIKTVSMADPLE